MAGLEVVVRPLIFPDIRPRARPALPPQDDPTKGFAVIQGNPAVSTSNSYSVSINWSQSRPVETERRVDEARIYQQDDDGTVNRDNFVDVEVANRISMTDNNLYKRGGEAPPVGGVGGPAPPTHEAKTFDEEKKIYFYSPLKAGENVEIRGPNKIRIYKQP